MRNADLHIVCRDVALKVENSQTAFTSRYEAGEDIAGIVSEAGNGLGMMPHPERMVEPAHGRTDGRRLFEGLLEAVG